MNIAIIGATGLVGNKISFLLEKRNLPVKQFIPIASEKSQGKTCTFQNKNYNVITVNTFIETIVSLQENIIIFFASTKNVSKTYIPIILEKNKNAWIIDNSSEYRLVPHIPLVIPEVNSDKIKSDSKLIANPNCSTAQLVMILHPLHEKYKIKRVVISTYQSVSGAGYRGINQLNNERFVGSGDLNDVFPTKIYMNCIPKCDTLHDNGYTGEELKLERETPKILDDDNIKITATAVRVPVIGGHSESVNIEFKNDFDLDDVNNMFNHTPGISVREMACPIDVQNEENVWVSRIRRDFSQCNTLNLWIVADNLMKGAALNAVQIAEYIHFKYNNVKNVSLIGMAAAGKSHISSLLSKKISWELKEMDHLIEEKYNTSLSELIETRGNEEFKQIEENITLEISGKNNIISTGGSIVYSEKAMKHLKNNSLIVYLDTPLETILQRIPNPVERGIVLESGDTLKQLYEKRKILYEKYYDVKIDCRDKNDEIICKEILKYLV